MGKTWDPECWTVGVWEDPEAGSMECLNLDEFSLPSEAASLCPYEKIKPTLPEETLQHPLS